MRFENTETIKLVSQEADGPSPAVLEVFGMPGGRTLAKSGGPERAAADEKKAGQPATVVAEQAGAGDRKPAEKKTDYSKLADQLGSESFYERESAQKQLIEGGAQAVSAVFAVRNSPDLEVSRRASGILEHLARHLELAELMKAPQLLDYLPQWSLSDRRNLTKQYLNEKPLDEVRKDSLKRLVVESDFLRQNPEYVKKKIARLEEQNKRPDLRDYEYASNDGFIASLKELDKLSAELRMDCLPLSKNIDEKRRLATEALQIAPQVVLSDSGSRYTLREAGLLKDARFMDSLVKANGDPTWAEAGFFNWTEVEKILDDRLALARKSAAEKPDHLVNTLHMVASAQEGHGDLAKAAKLYDEELELKKKANPSDTGLKSEYWRLAHLQLRAKDSDGAIKSFETIRKMLPDNEKVGKNELQIYDHLSSLYEARGDKKTVVDLQREAIKRAFFPSYEMNDLADRHIRIARCLDSKQTEAIESELKEAVAAVTAEGKDYKWATPAFLAIASFYETQDRLPEAISFYRRTVNVSTGSFDKEYVPALKKLISCLEKTDPASKEIADLRKMLKEKK
jgi:tetratricopeptide (TPR) repeat protein